MNLHTSWTRRLSTGSVVRLIVFVVLAVAAVAIVLHEPDGPATIASAGALTAALLLSITLIRRHRAHASSPADKQAAVQKLRSHPELLCAHHALTHSLCQLADQDDEVLRDTAAVRLATFQEDLRNLAAGKVVFAGTEAWRTAYERVLRTPSLGRYFSVAWLRSEDYWRDAPGRHSMQLNYDLIQLGVRIERTLILNDYFWPAAATLPAKVICQWIEEQYKRGIVIRLVRESEIEGEAELLTDLGIYGHRATGQLDLDEQCRTERFTLDFTPQTMGLFEERWRRLLLFAVPFRKLLDQKARGG